MTWRGKRLRLPICAIPVKVEEPCGVLQRWRVLFHFCRRTRSHSGSGVLTDLGAHSYAFVNQQPIRASRVALT